MGTVQLEPLMEGLKALEQESSSNLGTVLLAAWTLVVSRLSAQEVVNISVLRKRNREQGYNALLVQVDLTGEPNSSQLVDRVNEALSQAETSRLGNGRGPTFAEADPSRIQAGFYLLNVGHDIPLADNAPVRCDLELHLLEDKSSLSLVTCCSNELYYEGAAERIAGYFETALASMVIKCTQPIDTLDILSAEEKHLQLETWNQTDAEYPAGRCIHHMFEDQVAKTPEAVAIVHNEREVTYAGLDEFASRLATRFVIAGIKRGNFVAILLERSVDLIVTQLATLKVGAAYVVIDRKSPLERQAFMLKDSEAVLLVTDANSEVSSMQDISVYRLDVSALLADGTPALETSISVSSSDTAYVMYTSGTTGVPKAVGIPHCAIVSRVFADGLADIEPSDRVAFATNPSHYPSTIEIWVTLFGGARMVIIDNDIVLDPHRLAQTLVYNQVTALYLTNPLLHKFAFIIGNTLSTLKYLFGGADQGTVKAYYEVLKHGGPVRLVHIYGSTETPLAALAYVPPTNVDHLDRLPIGRPLPNIRCYVLGKGFMPVPIGAVGELYIGGHGISTGYLNRPDITEECFLPDPFSNVTGARMYKTGDLVRYLPDGNLEFLGYSDFQIKIRGYRIELGEIESRLMGHELVKNAAVLAVGDGDDKHLVAYVSADPSQQLTNILREYLALSLPEYMVPSAFVWLDQFPLTVRGKVDRSALSRYDFDSVASTQADCVPPQNDLEKLLATLWSELLKVDHIGRDDNFFMLGGHSLIAIVMIERLQRLGYSLSVQALFETPILHTLASSLLQDQPGPAVPSNPITPATTSLTPNMLPLINLTQSDIDTIVQHVPGGLTNIQDIYSLSPLQEDILFHHMVAKEADPYVITACTVFRDRKLLDKYLNAFQKAVDRHDILRTAILWENLSTPAQVVLRHVQLPVTEHILNPADGTIVSQLLNFYDYRKYRLLLNAAPLVRLAIAQDADSRWVMLELHHHIIGDRSTTRVLQEEIKEILKGGYDQLPTPDPYRNLIAEARLCGVSVDEHEAFFKDMVQDIKSPSLLYGISNTLGDVCDVTSKRCILQQDLSRKLRGHARRLGVSLASICHLAWARVVACLSGQDQVVFGTVLFGRMQGGVGSDSAMGLFVNTLPFRVDAGAISVQESVYKIQADLAALLQHKHAPLARVQRQSGMPTGLQLFNSLLNYRHNTAPSQGNHVDSGIIETVAAFDRPNYLFTISIEDNGPLSPSSLTLDAQVVQPYDPASICSYMQQTLENLAMALESTPQVPVQNISILPTDEYNMLIHTVNSTEAPYPSDVCIHQLFEDQAKSSPEIVAIVHNDQSMTYRELNAYANSIACRLTAAGVRAGDRVAIMLNRSIGHVAVQLAILKAGAAYVPIDTNAPVERQAYIVVDSGVVLLVTDERTVVPAQIEVPILRLHASVEYNENVFDSDHLSRSSNDTAYIMYTLGSTGQPKGVMVPHRGISRLFFNNALAAIGPGDCMAFVSNPAFDQSVYEIWAALLTGARLVVIDHDVFLDPYRFEETLIHHKVNFLRLTNAVIQQYAEIMGHTFSRLKYLIGAGEQASLRGYAAIVGHGGPVCLINSLGTTETTVDATMYVATKAINQLNQLPIGRPISNTKLYVLDKSRNPVPYGVIGELYIGGPGVANGYLNLPELTEERFVPDPFSNVSGARMYKTGDLVRWLPDGNLVYLGRDDFQVKIRGFRIELGEIENRLSEHPQVKDAVVVATGEGDNKRLVAYVVAAADDRLTTHLREYLISSLPEYMIPSAIVRMDVFPLNNNGKIDRHALPEPDISAFNTSDYSEPEGSIECALAEVWTELLKVERVGRHDNFFMLGGHSLLAVRLINRLSTTMGVQLSLPMLYHSPTLSDLAEALKDAISHGPISNVTISRASREGPLDLSFTQQRLWFLAQMEGVSDIYHVPAAFHLRGTLDKDALQNALDRLYFRHESLRSVFVTANGQPKVKILPATGGWKLRFHDLREEKDKEAVIHQLIAHEASASFDLEKGPLARAQLIQHSEEEQTLVFNIHHIIVDGWSLGVLYRELNELYMAYIHSKPDPLEPLSIQYQDYVAWQREWLTQDRLEDQATFWRNTLAGAPVSLTIPTDRPRPRQQSFAGGSVAIKMDTQLTSALHTLCQKHGVTMFMVVLAAWSAVLSRLSGQDDIVIGTPVANRNHPQVEQLVGFFVNTLVLRIDLSGDPSADQILERVAKVTIDAQAHQDIPFEQVVEIVQPPRRMDQTPIFQTMLAWQNDDNTSLQLHGVEVIPTKVQYDVVKFDLELFIGVDNDHLVGSLNYSTALFDHETVERHVGYLESILRWMTNDTDQSLGEVSIVGPLEKTLLLETWNDTKRPYPDNECIHRLFEKQVSRTPEAIAIIHDSRSMTYSELDTHANWIAQQLVAAGVHYGDNVAILMDRSIDLVATQIAILKVGAAYVPIDPRSPIERQVYIAKDCSAKLVVTDEIMSVPDKMTVSILRLRSGSTSEITGITNGPITTSSSMDTAYIMYTSGSTGQPKGVMVSHRGIVRLAYNNGFANYMADDRVAFSINPSFDPSTFDVWVPLLNGASVVIIDLDTLLDAPSFSAALDYHKITSLVITCALFHQYAYIIGSTLSKLKYLICGGEQGSIEAFSAVTQYGGPVQIFNVYGPTETTVIATAFEVTRSIVNLERLPIGRPIGNTRVYVLDKHLVPVPIGVVGELYIGGPGVANGYLNRPDLTTKSFVPDPFSHVDGARMYKTGDLVRYLPDGNLVFLGRGDNQIKIRGFRVELGEIESRLVEHPDVREAIVITNGEGGDKRLVAYVVCDLQDDFVSCLREYLSMRVPEYMVPSAFVRLDSMPLTNNGKIDRRALPVPDPSLFVDHDYEMPQGETESVLADLWSNLMKIDKIGRRDNFFKLGGHSLLAVKMIEQLRCLGYTLSVRTLFDNPVLYILAASIRSHQPLLDIPPNYITPTTTALTPDMLPLISLTQDDIDIIVGQMSGGLPSIQDIYALSPLQDGILFHHLMAEECDPYQIRGCVSFRNRDLLDHYLSAFQRVVDRHDILRTAFLWEGLSNPAQVVLRHATLHVREHIFDPSKGPIVDQLKREYDPLHYRMNLSTPPLIRFAIAKDVDDQWILLQLLHHLIGDYSASEVLNEEIDAILSGHSNNLPIPQPFRNLIAQARLGFSEEEHDQFFREMLHDVHTPSLPYGLSNVYNNGTNIIESFTLLPHELNHTLRLHSKRLGVSLAAVCHLAWAKVIASLSGQDRVVFGTVLFGRMRGGSGSDRAMGLFINTLPFRVDIDGSNVGDSVRKVQTDLAALLEHEHASLVRSQRLSGVPSGTPLFSSLLNYRHNTAPTKTLRPENGVRHLEAHERTNYPFTMSIDDSGDSLGLSCQVVQPYDPSRVCGYMHKVLQDFANALDLSLEVSIERLDIVPETEHDMIIHSWNSTDTAYPSDRHLHQLFEEQARRAPDAVAIVHGDRSLTYGELNTRANQVAMTLIGMGVQAGDNVAILMDRSIDLVATQIAILKVGAAYVPIDPRSPIERQVYIAKDCSAKLVVTDEIMSVPDKMTVSILRLRSGSTSEITGITNGPITTSSSMDTAYIMYTSGSTGQPKGVMVSHRGIVRLAYNNGFANYMADDRVAFSINPSFDPSTFDVWVPLLNGASVVIIDLDTLLDAPSFSAALDYHKITSLVITCALFHQYAYIIGSTLSKLKYLICGGEQGSIEAFSAVTQYGGPVQIFNVYGPTETTVIATAFEVTRSIVNLERLPIGRPIGNTRVYVLDKHLVPVPIGVVGELYIGGPGVANGYLNRPDLTTKSFVPDPFSHVDGARMYKTGDLVRYLPDGNLVFLGRGDNQIKIRGFRVELGEIESRLVEHPDVREAIVITNGEGGDKRLVAYVVCDLQDDFVSCLREYLSMRVPEYMVPSAFVRLDSMPLTNNGKIDRRALPVPDPSLFVDHDYEMPQGETESVLADLWSNLMKIDKIGRRDNFFKLGGHSLLAVKMIEQLRCLGYTLSVRTLFDNPVLYILAASIRSHQPLLDIPPNYITPTTTALTPDMLPLISLTQDDIDIIVGQMSGGLPSIQDIYALSPLQDGILFHHLMAEECDPYQIRGCVSFRNRDLLDHYLSAFQRVVDRHDILRTAFLWEGLSNPAQVVLRHATLHVREHIFDPSKGPIVDQLKREYDPLHYRMNLSTPPLIRFAIAKDVDDQWILLQLLHHLIGDYSASEVLNEEIDAILSGHSNNLPIPQPFRNLIAQARLGFSEEEHDQFFREMLHDVHTPSLPYGLSNVYNNGTNIIESFTLLPHELNHTLRLHSKRLGVSLAAVCHLAWAKVIASLSGQDRVVFGTVLFGRMRGGSGSDRAMGLFINTLPFRVDIDGSNVGDSVRKVQTDLAALLEHEHASLVRSQRLSGVPSGTPLFSSLLNYRHNTAPTKTLRPENGVRHLEAHERTNYPFTMSIDDSGDSLGLSCQVVQPYDPSRVCGYMHKVLQDFANALDLSLEVSIERLDIVPETEHDMIIHSWNSTDTAYPSDRHLHQLFEEQARRAPDAVAIVHGDRSLTYGELNTRANQVAMTLIGMGVQAGDNVAILMDRSIDLVATQIAILKVGAAYVPIDPRSPIERQVYIAKDCSAKLVVTDEIMSVPDKMTVSILRLRSGSTSEITGITNGPITTSSSMDTAYIMYTSGSTGQPKGVMVSHRGIVRLAYNNGFANYMADDRVAFSINPSFDPSTFDVWVPLLNGASVVIIDLDTLLDAPSFSAALDYHKITSLVITCALFHQYAYIIGSTLSKLKYLICGGEQGSIEAFSAVTQYGGPVQIFNVYGPTETTVIATAFEVTRSIVNLERLPIGRPIGNTRVYVLDKHLVPVPIGVVGELYIGGPGVANGYLNRPDLTTKSFVPDPFSHVDGARMYKTGDLVRYLPDGNLVFLGRGDNQIKIRGFRVELGEIESRLVEHPDVREAIVITNGEGGDKRLVAYVVCDLQDDFVSCLREYLSMRVPEYMVPSAFVRLDSMPLTNNGKIDRRALPVPDPSLFVDHDYEMPQGETESVLADLWSNLMKIDKIGRRDNFFKLGGHSLLAVKMIEQLRCLGYTLSVRTLFDNPVLYILAASIRSHQPLLDIPPNYITPTTTALTPDMLPLISLTQDDIDIIVGQMSGGLPSIQDIYALSPLQDGILFHHLMAEECDPYQIRGCVSFRNRDLLDHYLSAFQRVVDRHDILRTAFLWEGLSNPAQVVLRHATLHVREHIFDPSKGPIVDQLKREYDPLHYRMNLSTPPLIRFAIAKDVDDQWILLQLLHHLIGDYSASEVLNEEIDAILSGHSNNLPIPQPFRNLIAQARLGFSEEEHDQFFREMLHDVHTPSLPYGLSNVYNNGTNIIESFTLLPHELNHTLRLHSKRLGVSLAAVCHLAWAKVIASLSGQDRVVFGTVLFGRMRGGSGSDRAMGLFINTLPFRVDIDGSNVGDSVRKVQTDLAALLEHEHASLVRSQRLSGVPSGTPLFSSLLNYRHNTAPTKTLRPENGVRHLEAHERTNYPFTMSIDDSGDSLGLSCQVVQPYDPSRVCGYMHKVLQDFANALDLSLEVSIERLDIVPETEHDMIIHSWNNTDADYPSDRHLHQLFEDQARRTPEAVAVVHGDRSLTYGELNTRANQVAMTLIGMGVQAGDNVAILMDRSIDLVATQIAILKVGAAYVPIDPRSPIERQVYIAKDCSAKLVVTDEIMNVPDKMTVSILRLRSGSTNEIKGIPIGHITTSSSMDTAYIMYTSGSTGQPKGVMVSHHAVICRVLGNSYFTFTPDDCIAFASNPSFDASTFDVWNTLLYGCRMVIIDRETLLDAHLLSAAIDHYKITSILMVTALFHQYAYIIGSTLSKLKYLICGGDQGSIEAFSTVAQYGGLVRILNAYGPTEITVYATTFEITKSIVNLERLPIGRPIGNTRVYVLDKHLVPVPIGVVGELYIGGPGVANGYLNRPDLTTKSFVPDPFSHVDGARMYKTGDLVRYLPDGNLVFLGRGDNQIKIRGFRVELGEIESRLVEHPDVREAIVITNGEGGDKRLVAYVICDLQDDFVSCLREYLSMRVPEYMVPSAFVRLDSIPLTNNGKIDRRALPVPDPSLFVDHDYEMPQGETESVLADLWSNLLKIDKIGRHDNFFVLGGHSLMAIRMINIARTRLEIELNLQSLLLSPTIAELARIALQTNVSDNHHDEFGVLLPLKTIGNRPPLFCVHPGFGLSWSYRRLVQYLHPEQPLYALQARGLDGNTPLANSTEEMTLDYIGQIRNIQPHGPYNLLGWSLGGNVAHNIAFELEQLGEKVQLLVILDSWASLSEIAGCKPELEESDVDRVLSLAKDSDEPFDLEDLKRRVLPVAVNNKRLWRCHNLSVVNADIVFIRAAIASDNTTPLIDPVTWQSLTRSGVEVHEIQCTHGSLIEPEHVASVGHIISKQLDKLQETMYLFRSIEL